MHTVEGFLIGSCFIATLWLIAHYLNKKHWKKVDLEIDACECSTISRTAVKMQNAASVKMAAQDSRGSNNPLRDGKTEAPGTEQTKALPSTETQRQAKAATIILSLVTVVGVCVGVVLWSGSGSSPAQAKQDRLPKVVDTRTK